MVSSLTNSHKTKNTKCKFGRTITYTRTIPKNLKLLKKKQQQQQQQQQQQNKQYKQNSNHWSSPAEEEHKLIWSGRPQWWGFGNKDQESSNPRKSKIESPGNSAGDIFGMLKWPFQRLSDFQLGDEKVTLNHLAININYFICSKGSRFSFGMCRVPACCCMTQALVGEIVKMKCLLSEGRSYVIRWTLVGCIHIKYQIKRTQASNMDEWGYVQCIM